MSGLSRPDGDLASGGVVSCDEGDREDHGAEESRGAGSECGYNRLGYSFGLVVIGGPGVFGRGVDRTGVT